MRHVLKCLLLLFFSPLLAAADAATPTPLQYFGLIAHRINAGSPWPPFEFGSWRLWDSYVTWSALQPSPNKWDWRRLDGYVQVAEERHVEPMLTLALTPTWASARPTEKSGYKPGNAAEPRSLDDWREYVLRVATRYKGRIRQFDVWNEPSDTLYYTGDLRTMVEMTCSAYRIIKEVDPNNIVVSPAPTGPGRHLKYLDDFLAAGGKNCIDVVGYHFYVLTTMPEAMVPLIRDVRDVMAKNGVARLPLWNTETGWWIENTDGTPDHSSINPKWKKLSAVGDAENYLARSFIVARSLGVDRFYWYSWDNLYGLGMMNPQALTPKPMAAVYGRMVKWLTGRVVGECTVKGALWACPLSQDGRRIGAIVWTTSGGNNTWKPSDSVTIRSTEAADEGLERTDMSLPVRVGETPILVRY